MRRCACSGARAPRRRGEAVADATARRVEALSFTSTLSIGLSALFVTITFSLVLYRLGRGSIRGVEWVPLPETKPSNLLEMLPVLMILYVCHYNVHPIFAGMRRPTEKRMRRVVKTSLIFTTGVYWLIGLSAYLLFTSETQSNVLINYGHDLNLTGPGAKVASVIVEHVVKGALRTAAPARAASRLTLSQSATRSPSASPFRSSRWR